ncbi:Os08g0246550, partial [Oryza sativa Japonica Group]
LFSPSHAPPARHRSPPSRRPRRDSRRRRPQPPLSPRRAPPLSPSPSVVHPDFSIPSPSVLHPVAIAPPSIPTSDRCRRRTLALTAFRHRIACRPVSTAQPSGRRQSLVIRSHHSRGVVKPSGLPWRS